MHWRLCLTQAYSYLYDTFQQKISVLIGQKIQLKLLVL